MPLSSGTRLGPYEVLGPLGAGGMGEVYRARDTRLGRDVAIKLLPAEVAQDAERLARFRREAHLLASLNHPHIAAVYGLEEQDLKLLLVLELVEGEDLAERLRHGAIPVDEALGIAKQIAEALEEAHEKGIVHRDLKPANIKLTPDGKAKVLDFGLAKAYAADADSDKPDVSHSPTLTRAGTEAGVILGTAAYMSPEQARGKPLDRRADIWAFGVVLFEMLTGKRLFHGETTSDTLAAVLTREPDWNLPPAETPLRIRELLRRCLTRDPRQRLRDIGDARIEIETSAAEPATGSLTPARFRPGGRLLSAAVALGVVVGAVGIWTVVSNARRHVGESPRTVSRLSLNLPVDAPYWLFYSPSCNLAISRDGRQIAYVSGIAQITAADQRLSLRRLDDLTVRAIPDAEGATSPFFSPDGTWIAFFASDGSLKKVSLAGGRAVTIAKDIPTPTFVQGSWSDDGRIVFDTQYGGLRVVSAAGGPVVTLTSPSGEWHQGPQVLPDSEVVLYNAQVTNRIRIDAIALDGRNRKTLLENASRPRYLASGHLLFVRDGGLMIAPFDRTRVEITGPPASVPLEVAVDEPNLAASIPQLAVSLDGTLVYVPVAPGGLQSSTLVWVDRLGAAQEAGTVPFAEPRFHLSADGNRIVVTGRAAGKARVDLLDLSRKTETRLMDRDDVDYPTATPLSPDGLRLFFGRWNTERSELLSQPVDGSQGAQRITSIPGIYLTPASVSTDGRFVALTIQDAKTSDDIWVVDLEAKAEPRARPFLATLDFEITPAFAPDGHAIAYSTKESGNHEVYVRRFPEGDQKVRVTTSGGLGPQWSRDGTELFYQSPDGGKLFAVSVRKQRDLSFGEPRVLFEGPYLPSIDFGPSYAVSPDGRRFLMTRKPNLFPLRATELVVVQNWFEDVRRLTAAAR